MDDKPFVSIIIPMYNSKDYIEICLKSIFSLNYPQSKLEVIVVDNGSTDNSLEVVSKFIVKIIECPIGNISKVRNAGANAAKGDVYAFVDSDCTVTPHWLSSAVDILNRPGVVATGSGYKSPTNACWIEKAWLVESKIREREVNFIPCGNFIIKARNFHDIGGFDEKLVTCEDADICEKLVSKGYKIINSTKLESIHLRNPKTINAFFQKEIWYGSNMTVSLKNHMFDKVFWFTILFYLFHLIILFTFINKELFIISVIGILFLLNVATLKRITISRKYKLFFHLVLLYYVYFLARGIGILKGIANNKPKLISYITSS